MGFLTKRKKFLNPLFLFPLSMLFLPSLNFSSYQSYCLPIDLYKERCTCRSFPVVRGRWGRGRTCSCIRGFWIKRKIPHFDSFLDGGVAHPEVVGLHFLVD